MAWLPVRRALWIGALVVAVAGVETFRSGAEEPRQPRAYAASDNATSLSPSWTMPCARVTASTGCQGCDSAVLDTLASTRLICLEDDAGFLDAFDARSYPTLQISRDGEPERRTQRLDGTDTEAAFRIVAEVPRDAIHMSQRTPKDGFKPAGPLAADPPADLCSRPSTLEWTTCKVRPVPWDNPEFPDFPDPAKPQYFAPWHAQKTPGEIPGDFDKVFFEGIGNEQRRADGDPPTEHQEALVTPAQRRTLDLLAWQEFLAINWPSDRDAADTRRQIVGVNDKRRDFCPVWAGWRRVAEVMRAKDQLPIPWGLHPIQEGAGWVCPSVLEGIPIAMLSATGGELGVDFGKLRGRSRQPDGNVLWDVDGHFVVYDTRINEVFYGDMLQHWYFHGERPKRDVQLEQGTFYRDGRRGFERATPERQGPIAIKLAFKILTNAEAETIRGDRPRYIPVRAPVKSLSPEQAFRILEDNRRTDCDKEAAPERGGPLPEAPSVLNLETFSQREQQVMRHLARSGLLDFGLEDPDGRAPTGPTPGSSWNPQSLAVLRAERPPPQAGAEAVEQWRATPACDDEEGCLLGVVAMHVGHKTSTNSQWNWSTFIHREALTEDSGMFVGVDCAPDLPPACNTCDDSGVCRTRICRPPAPAPQTRALNEQIREMLQDSNFYLFRALSNYELLGIQRVERDRSRSSSNTSRPGRTYRRDPEVLLNPLMETFVPRKADLDDGREPDDDCHSCHARASWPSAEGSRGAPRIRSDLMFFLAPRAKPR